MRMHLAPKWSKGSGLPMFVAAWSRAATCDGRWDAHGGSGCDPGSEYVTHVFAGCAHHLGEALAALQLCRCLLPYLEYTLPDGK
eukprot:15364480-Ditylum_brightwellii.AAC.2